jgi:hypothetical protein
MKSFEKIPGFTISVLLLLFLIPKSFAQETNCIANYQAARTFYEAGRLDTTIALLETCFKNPKSFRQVSWGNRVEIYRLAAISSFLNYQPEQATQYVRELVKIDPSYQNNFRTDDIAEFRSEVSSYEPVPSLKLGIWGGANLAFPRQLGESYFVIEPPGSRTREYKGNWGYGMGLTVEYTLAPRFELKLNTGLKALSFAFDSQNIEYFYEQRMNYLDNQLFAKFIIIPDSKKTFHPYAMAGLYYGYLATASRKQMEEEMFTEPVKELMKPHDVGYAAGLGVTFQTDLPIAPTINQVHINVDVVYAGSLLNINDPLYRFDYSHVNEYIFEYYYILDDLSIRNIQISASLVIPLRYNAYKQ